LNFKSIKVMKRVIISAIITATVVWQTKAQDVQALMYKAYLTNSMSLWEKAVNITQKNADAEPENKQKLFTLSLSQYGLLSATMADKDEEQFDKYLDSTKENLEILIDGDYNVAESKAVLSSIYGLQMSYSPWKGMFLGSKSSGLIEDALRKSPESPLVNKLYAGSKLFTPEMFGGDTKVSIDYYKRSINLYEADSPSMENNWLYLDAMAFLGIAYKKAEQINKTITVYKKALKIQPEFGWVKNVLLPNAEKAKNSGE